MHEGHTYNCDTCGKVFAQKRYLVAHLPSHHLAGDHGGYMCDLCSMFLSSKKSLASHVAKHEGAQPFPCPKTNCTKAYTSKGALAKHVLVCGLTKEQRQIFQCSKCNKCLSTKNALKYHMQDLHTNPQSFVCPKCGYVCNSRGGLARHTCKFSSTK